MLELDHMDIIWCSVTIYFNFKKIGGTFRFGHRRCELSTRCATSLAAVVTPLAVTRPLLSTDTVGNGRTVVKVTFLSFTSYPRLSYAARCRIFVLSVAYLCDHRIFLRPFVICQRVPTTVHNTSSILHL